MTAKKKKAARQGAAGETGSNLNHQNNSKSSSKSQTRKKRKPDDYVDVEFEVVEDSSQQQEDNQNLRIGFSMEARQMGLPAAEAEKYINNKLVEMARPPSGDGNGRKLPAEQNDQEWADSKEKLKARAAAEK